MNRSNITGAKRAVRLNNAKKIRLSPYKSHGCASLNSANKTDFPLKTNTKCSANKTIYWLKMGARARRVAVIFAVALIALAALASARTYRQPIFVLGYAPCVIATSSMSPDYPAGSIVVLKKSDSSLLKVGDVVAFRSDAMGGTVALHRITRITNDGFFTKGDQNSHEDAQLVTAADYVGKCVVKKGFALGFLWRIFSLKGLIFLSVCIFVAVWATKKAINLYLAK